MRLWNMDNSSSNQVKISKTYILTLPYLGGMWCQWSVSKPYMNLHSQVWLRFNHPNFKCCTLYVSGTELRTERHTDDLNTRCFRLTFQARAIKKHVQHSLFLKFQYILHINLPKVGEGEDLRNAIGVKSTSDPDTLLQLAGCNHTYIICHQL